MNRILQLIHNLTACKPSEKVKDIIVRLTKVVGQKHVSFFQRQTAMHSLTPNGTFWTWLSGRHPVSILDSIPCEAVAGYEGLFIIALVWDGQTESGKVFSKFRVILSC